MEAATDAAQEAYSVNGEPEWVYTKESWADCVADIVTHPDSDEELRQIIRSALFWIDKVKCPIIYDGNALIVDDVSAQALLVEGMVAQSYHGIGELIIRNALKNGVTLENIGDVK